MEITADIYEIKLEKRKHRKIYDMAFNLENETIFLTELHTNESREEMTENIHNYKTIDHGLIPSDKLESITRIIIDELEAVQKKKRKNSLGGIKIGH